MTLSHRAEQAKPEEARGLLEELFMLRVGDIALEGRAAAQFGFTFRQFLLIDTPEAHLAAAMMLVPDGWYLSLEEWPTRTVAEAKEGKDWSKDQWRATLTEHGGQFRQVSPVAATPVLALIAAIAKAQEAGQ